MRARPTRAPGVRPPCSLYNQWVADAIRLDPPDILHVHDWFGTEGAAAGARVTGRPLVMTIHSTEYDRSLGHPWTEILDREKIGLAAADRVIAVSEHLKQQLIDRYGVDAAKVRVIYNAVRPTGSTGDAGRVPGDRPLPRPIGGDEGGRYLPPRGGAGRPERPRVRVRGRRAGPEYPRLLTLAAHLGIGDRVLFLGQVTEEERDTLLASASVFVLPSVVEPFGIAAFEAMSAGVPAIVSKTSGVAEMARSVFAVDFWDVDEFASRIVELLEYPVLRKTMGERGRWDAIREGWAERAIQTVQVYAEVLKPRRGTP